MGSINSSGSDCRPTSWILGRRPPGLGFGLLTICLHILHSVFKFKNVLHVFYPFLPSHSRWDPAIIKYHFTVPGWAEILCLVRPGQMMPLDCPFVVLRSTDIRCFICLCNIIFYFQKLQAPRSALIWGTACGIARVRWLCWRFFGHFRHAIRYGSLSRRSRNLYKMLPIYSSSIWHKTFDPQHRVPATIWRNPRQQNHSPAMQVRALDTALPSVVEDIKTIL